MTVRLKLFLFAALAALALLVYGGFGLMQIGQVYQKANFANQNTVPALTALADIEAYVAKLRQRANRHIFYSEDAEAMKKTDVTLVEARNKIEEAFRRYEKTLVDEEDRSRLDKVRKMYVALNDSLEPALNSSRAGRKEEARDLYRHSDALGKALSDALVEYIDYNGALARQAEEQAQAIYQQAKFLMVAFALVFIVLSAASSWWIIRSIVGPLSLLTECAQKIAMGDLSTRLATQSRDEIGQLSAAMHDTQATVQCLIDDLNHMSVEHEKGDIDARVDEQRFKGAFKVMASGINTMVSGHIAVKKQAMACVKAFGEGNLDAPLEAFPGKKRFINDTVEQLRGNLKRIVSEIQAITAAANRGDFSLKLDLAGKQGFSENPVGTVEPAFRGGGHGIQ